LRGYDYALPGAYFVTICAYNRECLFGLVLGSSVRLNEFGHIVEAEWLNTSLVRPLVEVDQFIVMPNHLHGIVVIHEEVSSNPSVGATRRVAPTRVAPTVHPIGPAPGSLGAIVGQFKSVVTKRINALRGTPGASVWQRNYYEHVIRSEYDMNRVREYIANNPIKWDSDRNNPENLYM
jgi:REP element-mobilizing transposase RayT